MSLPAWPAPAGGGWPVAVAAAAWALSLRRAARGRAAAAARACHELRGPLTAIGWGVELGLRRGFLDRSRLAALELELGRAALALEELHAGASRRERAALGVAETVVGEWLTRSVEAWRAAAGKREIRLSLSAGAAAAVVAGEPARLAQASGNLLANAIRHGDGTVWVRAGLAGGMVRVEVEDEGPGLAAGLAELGRGRHGLRVAAEAAERCGGRLLSRPSERGARLMLELPVARAAAARSSETGLPARLYGQGPSDTQGPNDGANASSSAAAAAAVAGHPAAPGAALLIQP